MSQKNYGRGQTVRNLQEARDRIGRGRDAPSSVMQPRLSVSQPSGSRIGQDCPTQS